ncbi:MAG: L,D-transpeptidase [Deltaproteobacteria bacterium]|nr:L,D-transpeptidase [Deltaproteobacteria bacterium]
MSMRARRTTATVLVATATAAALGAAPPITVAAEPTGTGRLYSIGYRTWIWPTPSAGGRFLGYLREGSSVALRSPGLVPGALCPRGFYAVEPRGYACANGTVTVDPDHPARRALADVAAAGGPLPYRYALSNGAPMYARLPTPSEQRRMERGHGRAGTFRRLPLFQRGHEDLAVVEPIAARDPVPPSLAQQGPVRGPSLDLVRRSAPAGTMLAFTRAFDFGGRTFLLSPDLTLLPADRVRPFRANGFRGVELGDDVPLPIAWFRREPRPQYRRVPSGRIEPTGASWPARSFVQLAGGRIEQDGRAYLETAPPPGPPGGGTTLYAAAADATVVQARAQRPFLVGPGRKWMLVSIGQGTLVAYEDLRPVYATLISPGRGGVPIAGRDPIETATTPLGTYNITFKDRAATMAHEAGEERSSWIADVPHIQYFAAPFALHGAYWHDELGEPISAGCVNLSPADAKWLFDWSDPPVPEGWQGATGAAANENGPTSAVVVTR